MCRWFAYISPTEPCLLEDVLVTPAHSLTKQVHEHYLPKLLSHDPKVHAEPTTEAEITARNRLFNVDGFGVAWYTKTMSTFSPGSASSSQKLFPALYKCIQPPLHDSNFRSLASNTSSRVVFAHIRAATSTAITPTNNHPFVFSKITVMHNGMISQFSGQVKSQMCDAMTVDAYDHIQGGTDTEHLAALFMSYLCPETTKTSTEQDGEPPEEWNRNYTAGDMRAALEKTIGAIIAIKKRVLGDKAEPNSLNIAITDGASLVACRYRNHPTEQPPSLYYSTTAGVTLNRQFSGHPDGKPTQGEKKDPEEHGKHFIVASEPSTYKENEWTLIEKNRYLEMDANGDVSEGEMSV